MIIKYYGVIPFYTEDFVKTHTIKAKTDEMIVGNHYIIKMPEGDNITLRLENVIEKHQVNAFTQVDGPEMTIMYVSEDMCEHMDIPYKENLLLLPFGVKLQMVDMGMIIPTNFNNMDISTYPNQNGKFTYIMFYIGGFKMIGKDIIIPEHGKAMFVHDFKKQLQFTNKITNRKVNYQFANLDKIVDDNGHINIIVNIIEDNISVNDFKNRPIDAIINTTLDDSNSFNVKLKYDESDEKIIAEYLKNISDKLRGKRREIPRKYEQASNITTPRGTIRVDENFNVSVFNGERWIKKDFSDIPNEIVTDIRTKMNLKWLDEKIMIDLH